VERLSDGSVKVNLREIIDNIVVDGAEGDFAVPVLVRIDNDKEVIYGPYGRGYRPYFSAGVSHAYQWYYG
jgi:hypothetical protein